MVGFGGFPDPPFFRHLMKKTDDVDKMDVERDK